MGAAASRTAKGTVMADAPIATAVASLIKRARRARRGFHSYTIRVPRSLERHAGSGESILCRANTALANARHCKVSRASYLLDPRFMEAHAMKDIAIEMAFDDAMEIVAPNRGNFGYRSSTVCLCCNREDQPIDDDGCGICDRCLGLPTQAEKEANDLEILLTLPQVPLPIS